MKINAADLSEFAESLPRISTSIIHRPRLHRQLDNSSALTFITAPHGYGKTTLLVSWLEKLEERGIDMAYHWWEGSRFKRPLTLAQKCQSLRKQLRDQRKPTIIVIDRFDEVSRDGDETLLSLVREFRSLRLVISMQNADRVATWHAYDLEPHFITGADLRFTEKETRDLHKKVVVDTLTAQIDDVHKAVGGWPVLVHASALAGGGLAAAKHYLRDKLYLSETHQELVDFVTKTNCGVALTLQQAQYLAPGHRAAEVMAELRNLGVITESQDADGKQRFTYIEVINEFMAGPDSDIHMAGSLTDLARRCAAEKDYLSASRFFARVGKWGEIDDMLQKNWYGVIDHPELHEVLSTIPPASVQEYPFLATMIEVLAGPEKRSGRLPRGLEGVAGTEIEPLFQVCLRAGYLRFNGNFTQSSREFAAVRAVLKDFSPRTKQDLSAVAVIYLQIAINDLLINDFEAATNAAIKSYRLARESGFRFIERNAAGLLALCAVFAGNGEVAKMWLTREAQAARDVKFLDEMVKTAGLIASTLKHLGALEITEAEMTMSQCNDVTVMDEMWPFIAYAKAEHALLTGNFAQGLRDLETAVTSHPGFDEPGTLISSLLAAARSNLLLAMGEGPRVIAELENAEATHPMIRAVRARSKLLSGKYAEVIAIARRHSDSEQSHDRAVRELRLLAAAAKFQLGDIKDASRLLTQFLDDDGTGMLRALALAPRALLERMIAKTGVGQDDLAKVHSQVPNPLFDVKISTVSLTPRERTVLQLLQQGLSTPEVAEQLVVSANTVKSQLRSAYRKLGANSRAEALARAAEYGLLT